MNTTIIVTIFTADPADIRRGPDGTPRIESHTGQSRLYMATRSDDAGWLLETWGEASGEAARQQMGLIPDTAHLAAEISRAVQAIASSEE